MKLKIGDEMYLQKYDVAYIIHELNVFPDTIMQEMLCGDGDMFFIMNGVKDAMKFSIAFKRPENIKWLLEQDYLLDYEGYKKKSVSELETLYQSLKAVYFASMEEFGDDEYEDEADSFEKLGHKIASLKYLIDMNKGELCFTFPDGYRDDSSEEKQKNKPSFIQRLFSHDAQ